MMRHLREAVAAPPWRTASCSDKAMGPVAWPYPRSGFVLLKCEGDYSPWRQGDAVASDVTVNVQVVRPLFIGGCHCAILAL
jgi:hypothetical protein